MNRIPALANAFTLLELLVVIAIIVILSSLLLPAVANAKSRVRGAVCLNNLRQVNLAARMYAEDHGDAIDMPARARTSRYDFHLFKEQIKSYASLRGKPSPSELVFACPADTFFYSQSGHHSPGFCKQADTDFTSYAFNGANYRGTNSQTLQPFPGIAGMKFTSIVEPAKTALIFEAAALTPFSWHHPVKGAAGYRFADAKANLSFIDGHASETKIHWNGATNSEAWHSDPPPNYAYKWSGN